MGAKRGSGEIHAHTDRHAWVDARIHIRTHEHAETLDEKPKRHRRRQSHSILCMCENESGW